MQHGFSQTGAYFEGSPAQREIYNQLAIEYPFATTTDYGAIFQEQASAVGAQVEQRWGGAGAIFVGHSNGGIVARQLGQWRPDLVKGVISISSPHDGVPLLRFADGAGNALKALLGPVFLTMYGGCKLGKEFLCQFTDTDRLFSRIVGGDGRPVPVWDQETPGKDTYLHNLNAQPESFPRAGIEQQTRQRWLFFRVLGDQQTGCRAGYAGETWYGHPCGREKAAATEQTYADLRKHSVVRWTWNPFKLAGRVAVAAAASVAKSAMNGVDGLYNNAAGGGDGSDGLVPFRSQRYPNASVAPVIVRAEDPADSHSPAAASPTAVRALVASLGNFPFNVARRRTP